MKKPKPEIIQEMPSKSNTDDPWIYCGRSDDWSNTRDYIGKWMVFRKPEDVDEVWNGITSSIPEKLTVAKVSTKEYINRQGTHVICIYTKDYRDIEDVKKTLNVLRSLGIQDRIYYKPDVMTMANVYGHNSKTSHLYSSADLERGWGLRSASHSTLEASVIKCNARTRR
jgi:hypothetical protein